MEQQPGKSKTDSAERLSSKALAHLGDAVYELFIRERVVFWAPKIEEIHNLTTSYVNASFHTALLDYLMPSLLEDEVRIVKRARNQALSTGKRREQATHRLSTAFEALIGHLYLSDKERLSEIFSLIESYIQESRET